MQKFAYSAAQWALVVQALKRIGVDADRATVPWRDAGCPLRSTLEAFCQSYIETRQNVLSLKSREEFLKPVRAKIKGLLAVLKDPRVRSLIVFGTDNDNETNRIAKASFDGNAMKEALNWKYHNLLNELHSLDMSCVEACNPKARKYLPEAGQRIVHHLQEHEVFFEMLIKSYVDLGGRPGGDKNGPAVTFLLSAAQPVLGAETPTNEACRTWLRRRLLRKQ